MHLRVEDCRDALTHLEVLPEVLAFGAFQMNDLWPVTFGSQETMKEISFGGTVKEHQCLLVDPVTVTSGWSFFCLLHNVHEEEVRVALASYGKVTDVWIECWRIREIIHKGSSTRAVTLQLKADLTIGGLPHQMTVAGIAARAGQGSLLSTVSANAAARREFRMPRCKVCRRFGHEENQCTKT